MKAPLYIGQTALLLAGASVAALVGGTASLVAAFFWATSVLLPLGIGGVVGGWLLFQYSMERMSRDNRTDAER